MIAERNQKKATKYSEHYSAELFFALQSARVISEHTITGEKV